MEGKFRWKEPDGTEIGPLRLDVAIKVFPEFHNIYVGMMVDRDSMRIPIIFNLDRESIVGDITFLEGKKSEGPKQDMDEDKLMESETSWFKLDRDGKKVMMCGTKFRCGPMQYVSFEITMTVNESRKVCHMMKQSLEIMDEMDWNLRTDLISDEMAKKYKLLAIMKDYYDWDTMSSGIHDYLCMEIGRE